MTPEEARKRIEEARKKTAQIEATREANHAEFGIADEVRMAEQDAQDAEAILKAEDEHGIANVAVVETDLGAVVVRRPNPVLFKRHIDRAASGKDMGSEDAEKFVRPCVVHPTAEQFGRMIDERPGILGDASLAAFRLAGSKREEDAEK